MSTMPLLRDDSMVPIRVHMRVHQCDHVVSHRGFTPWFHTVVSHRGFTPWFHTVVSHRGFTLPIRIHINVIM